MRYLYEVDIADPALYDLVVNTERLRGEAVVGQYSCRTGTTRGFKELLALRPAASEGLDDRRASFNRSFLNGTVGEPGHESARPRQVRVS